MGNGELERGWGWGVGKPEWVRRSWEQEQEVKQGR